MVRIDNRLHPPNVRHKKSDPHHRHMALKFGGRFASHNRRVAHLSAILNVVGLRTSAAASAVQQSLKSSTKFDRHDAIEDRIDGAVQIDHETTEQQEPDVLIAMTRERVVDDERSVREPQDGEHADDYRQHLRYLNARTGRRILDNNIRSRSNIARRTTTSARLEPRHAVLRHPTTAITQRRSVRVSRD